MRLGILAVSASDRWLVAASLSLVVVVGCWWAARSWRILTGCVLVLAPCVALPVAGRLRPEVVVAVVAASGVGLVEILRRRAGWPRPVTFVAIALGGGAVVVAGARLAGTGVGALAVVGALVVVVGVTGAGAQLPPVLGALAAVGVFALAAFSGQDGLATVALAVGALAFGVAVLPGADHDPGEPVGPGRSTIAFTIGALALVLVVPPAGARGLLTPLTILVVLLVDAMVVVAGRYARRVPLTLHRADHLSDRSGGHPRRVLAVLFVAQIVAAVVALFCGRGVWPVWVAALIALVVAGVLLELARRARPEPLPSRSLWTPAVLVGVVVCAVVAAAAVPGGLFGPDAYHDMQRGRDHATRGLQLARGGKARQAESEFRAATSAFVSARDALDSPWFAAALALPYVASNVRAARVLSEVGVDLASAGASVAAAADPDRLSVVDGRLPLAAVRSLVPRLARGAAALDRAAARLRGLRADPYLAGPVRDVVDKVDRELVRARREVGNASLAASLASAILGGRGDRSYLLVMQNPAEDRATGGFIGSYSVVTARDGQLSVGPVLRTATWNNTIRAVGDVKLRMPLDYALRYARFQPATNLQNVNLSPDFPTVGEVLGQLAPQAGAGEVDGVFAVDPLGLAALLRLTGPVQVESWPDPIDASDVVRVTLSEAYSAYASTPDRADFLGDVARAAVDKASSRNLGTPAELAKVLGAAAHDGHIVLSFERPAEQRLAERLGVGMQMDPVRSDAVAVTTSNAAGNKIDYYQHRSIDYQIALAPDIHRTAARASAVLSTKLTNDAPDRGLPESVIGPSDPRFAAGENRAYVSLYSPMALGATTVDGSAAALDVGREVGRNVGSLFVATSSRSTSTIVTRIAGAVALRNGWYELQIRNQPSVHADRMTVSVSLPAGWKIVGTDHVRAGARGDRATAAFRLRRTTTLRVKVAPVRSSLSVWDRLRAGSS
jgi:hypothetical protein